MIRKALFNVIDVFHGSTQIVRKLTSQVLKWKISMSAMFADFLKVSESQSKLFVTYLLKSLIALSRLILTDAFKYLVFKNKYQFNIFNYSGCKTDVLVKR